MTGVWRRTFEGHVATIMRVHALPRLETERVAFENVLVEHLNATHPDTSSDRCAHCGRAETPFDPLAPIGAASHHTWLHDDCWTPWRELRRAKAVAELKALGLEPITKKSA